MTMETLRPTTRPTPSPRALPAAIRRRGLLALLGASLLGACAGTGPQAPANETLPPIVFVHGNGDSAALWSTTLWRWESNGWPRARLHAVNFPEPQARDDDTQPQPGRSSTTDQLQHLATEIDAVLARTGATRVVLMGNSRGGNAIRHYIADWQDSRGRGAARVSHAILGGTPNHGVWADPAFRPNNEFNGAGPFLTRLNAPKGPNGDEVTPGVAWMTIRSDNNDKFAQPEGTWIGAKGKPTNVTAEGPALKGATNVVLPGRDHREVSYHAEAFAQAFRFVTGRAPAAGGPLYVVPQQAISLSGLVTGIGPAGPSNRPLAGATLAVFAVDAATGQRLGAPLLQQSIGADGRWGPLATDSRTALEFVLDAPGFAISHTYRAPFARSSDLVHLRPERLATDAERAAGAAVLFTRPRAYFGVPRDQVLIDGQPAPGIPEGVAGVASSRVARPAGVTVVGSFRSGIVAEQVAGRTWPAAERHVTVLELHE